MNADYRPTLEELSHIAGSDIPASERLRQAMEAIQQHHPKYEWIGIYVLRGDTLELGPYVGAATDHTSIPVGVGVCGTAVAQQANQVIEDVRALDNYLSCSPTVRSEIVVLIRDGEQILGQIDSDCDEVGAFDEADEAFLEQAAAVLAPLVKQAG